MLFIHILAVLSYQSTHIKIFQSTGINFKLLFSANTEVATGDRLALESNFEIEKSHSIIEKYYGRSTYELPAHIYGVAESAYRSMKTFQEDQG